MEPHPAQTRPDAEAPAAPPRPREPVRAGAPAVRIATATPAVSAPAVLAEADERLALTEAPPDQRTAALREQLEAIRLRAGGAASWLETSKQYEQLINRDGFVPVTAKFYPQDLIFLSRAREELRGFVELSLTVIELHQPLDAGGITSDPAVPIQRCRSCMWRWPCPTFRAISEVLDRLEST
ncbi:MAG: hypothetical protein ACLPUO_09070 [Streptosporangiaceae bacterium]|jgi:hypothetical protein